MMDKTASLIAERSVAAPVRAIPMPTAADFWELETLIASGAPVAEALETMARGRADREAPRPPVAATPES